MLTSKLKRKLQWSSSTCSLSLYAYKHEKCKSSAACPQAKSDRVEQPTHTFFGSLFCAAPNVLDAFASFPCKLWMITSANIFVKLPSETHNLGIWYLVSLNFFNVVITLCRKRQIKLQKNLSVRVLVLHPVIFKIGMHESIVKKYMMGCYQHIG